MSKALQSLIIFTVISLSGLLALVSEQRSLCARSSIVDLIEDSTGQIYLFSCKPFTMTFLAAGPPGGADLPRRLKRSVERLEWLAHLLPRPPEPLQIVMTDLEPFYFQVAPHGGVQLGSVWANHEPSFLRAMIHAWLVKIYPELEQEPLNLGVWTSYLLAHLQGEYQIESWDGQMLRQSDVTYSRMAVSLKEYCLSPFKSLAHFDVCSGVQNSNWKEDRASLWPLVHLRALKAYQAYSSLEALRTQVSRLSQNDFELVSIEGEEPPLDIAFVLREESLSDRVRQGLRVLDEPVLLESDHRRYWVSKWGEVDVSRDSGQSSAQDIIPVRMWMDCEAPRWERLLSQTEGDWLWVPICTDEIDLSELLTHFNKRGLQQAFAAAKDLPFIWINGQGLQLIEKLDPDLKRTAQKKFDLIRARKFEFWKNDVWDSRFNAFRPRSAIHLVRWHRANQNILGLN